MSVQPEEANMRDDQNTIIDLGAASLVTQGIREKEEYEEVLGEDFRD